MSIADEGTTTVVDPRAGDDGRLRIEPVPLGPPNPFQELTPAAQAAGGTRVSTATVSIEQAPDETDASPLSGTTPTPASPDSPVLVSVAPAARPVEAQATFTG